MEDKLPLGIDLSKVEPVVEFDMEPQEPEAPAQPELPEEPAAPMEPEQPPILEAPVLAEAPEIFDAPECPEDPQSPVAPELLEEPEELDLPADADRLERFGSLGAPDAPPEAFLPTPEPQAPEEDFLPEAEIQTPKEDFLLDEVLWEPKRAQEPPQPPQPPAPRPQAPQKKSRGWLWLLAGIGIGFVLGLLCGLLFRMPKQTPAKMEQTEAPAPQGDLSGRLQRDEGAAAVSTLPSEVYSQNVASVVGIVSESTVTNSWGQSSTAGSFGTGFIISEDGYVLTNYHVVQGNGTVTVLLYDGRELPATLVGYDSDICDLALLKIEAEGLEPVTFGDSDALQVGQQVCAIGNPLGELTYSLTVGYISAKDRIISTEGSPINMLQTDCTINSGNSGGPLFDMNGNVIGITTAKYSGTTSTGTTVEGIGFAIPINDVVVLLDDLQTYGHVATQPYLGVSVRISMPAGDYPAGAYINDVVEGEAAAAAGIQAGDILTGLGDYPIDSYNGLCAALRYFKAGDKTEVTLWRNGETLTLPIVLGTRPSSSASPEPSEAAEPTDPTATGPYGWSWSWQWP